MRALIHGERDMPTEISDFFLGKKLVLFFFKQLKLVMDGCSE